MTSPSYESDSGEQASTTADEVEGSSRRSTTEDSASDSTTDTDSNNGMAAFSNKNLTPRECKKYANGLLDHKKLNVQSDTETKNLLDDVGEDFDEDYLNLQETEIELDPKMFELTDDQINYYTDCFLYLMEKTQGFPTLQGALQGNDRTVLNFFRKSRLNDVSLSRIWSLADVNEDGFLNYHEFITAMHLIVLHVKGNLPIPAELPQAARPLHTPTRSLVRFQNGFIGAFPSSQADSASNSSTKVISECISSSSGSGNSQQLIGAGSGQEKAKKNASNPPINNPTIPPTAAFAPFSDASTNNGTNANAAKQHSFSFSDDHLHSTSSQREVGIAKFSDVPPLLVDSQPTALNAASSQILPLLASTTRGPPPQPPYRDYNDGNSKGHGRSASLDLKTFSALSTTIQHGNRNHSAGIDEPDMAILATKLAAMDKAIQTDFPTFASTSTQTVSTEENDENLALCIRDLDTAKLTPKERCELLQRINEQLELERATLMQVRLQVQLRIEEAESELGQNKGGESSLKSSGNKPTTL